MTQEVRATTIHTPISSFSQVVREGGLQSETFGMKTRGGIETRSKGAREVRGDDTCRSRGLGCQELASQSALSRVVSPPAGTGCEQSGTGEHDVKEVRVQDIYGEMVSCIVATCDSMRWGFDSPWMYSFCTPLRSRVASGRRVFMERTCRGVEWTEGVRRMKVES